MNVDWIKGIYFHVNEFEVGINDTVFSGNEQLKLYLDTYLNLTKYLKKHFFIATWRHLK